LNLGIIYHQQQKYPDAVKVLETAVSLQPGLLGAQLFLGIDEYLVQDLKGAVQHLSNALQLKPDDRQAGMYLALTYLALDQPEKAAQQLRQTAHYFPEDPEIFYYQGEAYLNGIAQSLRLLRQSAPDSALYHWALALAAEQKSDLVTAVQEYLKALARDPGIADLYLRLAVAFAKLHMPDLTSAALDKYKLLNPARDPASFNLKEMADVPLANEHAASESRELFVRLWQALPPVKAAPGLPAVADDFVNRALKGRMASPNGVTLKDSVQLYLRGDYAKAAERIRPNADRRADTWLSAYLLARCYLASGDFDAAQRVIETQLAPYFKLGSVAILKVENESRLALRSFDWVAANQPNSYLGKLLLARSYAAARRDHEAIALYEEVLKLAPGRLGVHLAIGQIHETRLHWESAIQEYKEELALAPDNAMALAHLGHAYTQARDPERAIEALERLLANNPTDGQAYADLGKARVLQGETRKAIAAYEQALRYDPDENDLHYRLFQLYTKIGEGAVAQNHLAAFKEGEARQGQAYRESMAGHQIEGKTGTN
jgi:tetratricopeptide (TPR) repeat protein